MSDVVWDDEQAAPGVVWDDAGKPAPATPAPLQVGGGETFLNKGVDAVPAGRLLTNALSALAMKALRPKPGVEFGPAALAAGLKNPEAPSLVDEYRNARDTFASRTAAGAQQNPKLAALGTGVGTALSLAAPLPKFAVGTGATGRVLSNALTSGAYGTLNGALNSRGDLTRGDVGQVLGDAVGIGGLKQAAHDFGEGNWWQGVGDVAGAGGFGGMLTGGVLGAGVEGAKASGVPQRLLQSASGTAQRFANRKALNALGAMKPELNRLGTDAADELGQYALNKGLISKLGSRESMAGNIDAGRKAAGNAISGALAELDAKALPAERVNSVQAAGAVDQLAQDLSGKPALAGIADKFRAQANTIRTAPGAGPMSLADFEQNVARPYKATTNWNADLALPKETLQRLPRALEAQVEAAAGKIAKRTGSDALDRYVAGKGDYGKMAELADIAEQGLRRQASNHTLGLKDVMSGIMGASVGAAHHGPVGGLLMGTGATLGGKLLSRYGDQMSAVGANRLAGLLRGAQAPASGVLASELAAALRSPAPMMSPGLAQNDEAAQQLALAEAMRQGAGR